MRSRRSEKVVIPAAEPLLFPADYHARGVLSLPYGDIVEPFEVWHSATRNMSRIDYYGGKTAFFVYSGLAWGEVKGTVRERYGKWDSKRAEAGGKKSRKFKLDASNLVFVAVSLKLKQ